MKRILAFRHGKAQPKGIQDILREIVDPKQILAARELLAAVHFFPDLVFVSDAVRTGQTASLLVGDSVPTLKIPELRNMGRHEYEVVRAIMMAQGEGASFKNLLAADARRFWMNHAEMVAQLLRDIIAKNDAHQVLVVTHEYTINPLCIALRGEAEDILLGPPPGYTEGFLLDDQTGLVTRIAKDSP